MNLRISSVDALAQARAFRSALEAHEADSSKPLPDPAFIFGVGDDDEPNAILLFSATLALPPGERLIPITTSRDLDELESMVSQMQLSDESTQMHIGDVTVSVLIGSLTVKQ